MLDYPNVSRSIGMIVSRKYATLHELQTVYGSQDLYDLIEIIIVDGHNERVMSERKE